MLIEQNFELKGPEPSGRIYTPITDCLHNKTIIFIENVKLDCYLRLKYRRRQRTLLPLPGPNQLQNLTPKFKILNVV